MKILLHVPLESELDDYSHLCGWARGTSLPFYIPYSGTLDQLLYLADMLRFFSPSSYSCISLSFLSSAKKVPADALAKSTWRFSPSCIRTIVAFKNIIHMTPGFFDTNFYCTRSATLGTSDFFFSLNCK